MPATFSINIGTQFESYRKPDILSVLKDIPDNTNKQITPRDIRDAFLSTWASSPFKQTQSSLGIEYIGIDSGNPSDRDIKQKILLGKRSFGNLDILSSALLSDTAADIFIYNTKLDSATQSNTTVAFLAGTNSALHTYAPYIQASSGTNSIGFELRNPSIDRGPIAVYSSTGRVAINGILFPTVAENTAGAANGKILRYYGSFPNGYLKWDDSNVSSAELGAPGSVFNIYGGTVSLNGYELEFVNPALVPSAVGGVPSGFSFSSTSFNGNKWPIVEVLRKLLYPYTPPVLSLTATNRTTGTKYAEVGTSPIVDLKWNLAIYPRTSSEYVNDYVLAYTYSGTTTQVKSGLSFSGLPGKTFSGTASNTPAISPIPSSPTRLTYIFSVTDVPGITASSYIPPAYFGFTHSATASIEYVYPIYYGFTSSAITNSTTFTSTIPSLSKHIAPHPGASSSVYLSYTGEGYMYFIYHSSFAAISSPSSIKDPNGFNLFDKGTPIYSSFGSSAMPGLTFSGYVVWRTTAQCAYAGDGKFEFKF